MGTGSGILAIWSAQAGARKVYAVEATNMAEHARELARANGVADIVEVIQGTVEDVELPEKGETDFLDARLVITESMVKAKRNEFLLQLECYSNHVSVLDFIYHFKRKVEIFNLNMEVMMCRVLTTLFLSVVCDGS